MLRAMPEGADPDQLVVVALGSNLPGRFGSCAALLEAVVGALAADALTITAVSSWWRSKAWPDSTAPTFFNGVVLGESHLAPGALMAALGGIEANFGRIRAGANAPRTLDLDLIACGRVRLDAPGLVIPHPRASARLFVMGPLAEIAPAWRHPTTGATAAELAAGASVGRDAAPIPKSSV